MIPHDFMSWLLLGFLGAWAVVVAYSIADAVRAERDRPIELARKRELP